jgi:undecaprenyl-diphosphatase
MEAISAIDKDIYIWVQTALRSDFLDQFLPFFRMKLTWFPLYIFPGFLLVKEYKIQALWFIGATLLVVGITDPISSLWLKKLIARPRPCEVEELLAYFPNLTHCSAGFSMPSSHAANHFAIAIFLGLSQKERMPRLLPILIVWALTICFAQLYVGVHYPSDLLVGALLGSLIAILVFVSFKKILKNRIDGL